MNIPIFPLSIYLLPQGITRLRIFEQRYLNMVKNANDTKGFVISYYQNLPNQPIENQIAPWGSWVEIVNFMQGDDGILIIDVKCKSLVTIKSTSFNDEQLMLGEVTVQPHWADKQDQYATTTLSQQLALQLQQVFSDNKPLADLYQQVFVDDDHWVCARWLELLPLPFADKSLFSQQDSFNQALDCISNILIEEKV
ncbi:LON peptidase substrate-binding domain-containing protein [Thalassomonas sp. M1454]|uniref:LON peptidase substrate-binding domain-containing protein n=1 Tax=Thalassomonas sp. M1454 TaxID=2594477 RepID=UPI001180B203|nr:LON peptidase substrate-binding domain-containing protein [Thalassomonas sp. M1454]TRX54998.1 hypothetical protein FNN08_10375 [Thalassomonas sp. M1454]